MTGIVEKNYSEALFLAISEDCPDKLEEAMRELETISGIIGTEPGFAKLCDAPTVCAAEKLSVIEEVFGGSVSQYVYNFLRLLAENGRMGLFGKIVKRFRILYNDYFNIADITVTSAFPLTEKQTEDIKSRMAEITGKNIIVTVRTDKALVGGVVIDYGDQRFDGSVKTRLETLKQSFSQLIG